MRHSSEVALVASVAPKIMRDLRITYPVTITFDQKYDGGFDQRKTPYAMATRDFDGTNAEVSLPSDRTVKKYMPDLTPSERRAKLISQVAEELCHLDKHQTCHIRAVGSCTIRMIRKNVPARELRSEFMREKIDTLRETMRNPELDSCPDRLELERRGRKKKR